MMLDRVVDFITDRDMQASSEVRIAMLDFLKIFMQHLDSGYVPSKDVQRKLDHLESVCKEFEENLVASDFDSPLLPEVDEVVEEVEEEIIPIPVDEDDDDEVDDDDIDSELDSDDDEDDVTDDPIEDDDDDSA